MTLGPSEIISGLACVVLLIVVKHTSSEKLKYSLINFHSNLGKSEFVDSIIAEFNIIKLARYPFL